MIYTAGLYVAYTFINAQTGVTSYPYEINGSTDPQPVNSTLRLIICALAPVVIDMGCLGVCLAMACCAGPMLDYVVKRQVLLLLVLPMVLLPSLFILFSLLLCGSLKVSFCQINVGYCHHDLCSKIIIQVFDIMFRLENLRMIKPILLSGLVNGIYWYGMDGFYSTIS